MSSLPEWMLPRTEFENPSGEVGGTRVGRGVGTGAVRRAAAGFARLVAQTLADQQCASRRGLLQAVDARAKVVGLLAVLVTATLVHRPASLAAGYLVCVLLAALSRVSARRFVGVWLFVPLFSAAIMLPATLNVVTEGRHVLTLVRFSGGRFLGWDLPEAVAVTDAGLLAAGTMVLRTAVCVSLALLLTVTTARARLFGGLRALGAPRIFVALLGMMDRYLELVVRAAEEVHLARISRSVGPSSLRREHAWAAAGIGSVFRRSYALSQAVYLAMLSRGYTGEVRLLDEPPMRAGDWVFLACAAAVSASLLYMG